MAVTEEAYEAAKTVMIAHFERCLRDWEATALRAALEAALAHAAVPPATVPGEWDGVDNQIGIAAFEMSAEQKNQPEWLWYDNGAAKVSLGRWTRYDNQAPYIRADIAAAPAPAPAPVQAVGEGGAGSTNGAAEQEERLHHTVNRWPIDIWQLGFYLIDDVAGHLRRLGRPQSVRVRGHGLSFSFPRNMACLPSSVMRM